MTPRQLSEIESRAHPLDDDKWELILAVKNLLNRVEELETIIGIQKTEPDKTLFGMFK
jgi:hypothetical protein